MSTEVKQAIVETAGRNAPTANTQAMQIVTAYAASANSAASHIPYLYEALMHLFMTGEVKQS